MLHTNWKTFDLNIKKVISNIGFYAIFIILFFGMVFIMAGIGGRGLKGNSTFIWIGLLLITPFVLYFILDCIKSKRKEYKSKLELENFKKTADKIVIDLENIKIKSNSWTDTVVVDNTRYGGLNQLTGNEDKNIKMIKRDINYVKISVPYKEKTLNFNLSVAMEATILKMHFAIKKETILYVDPENPDNYYLDMEFLN